MAAGLGEKAVMERAPYRVICLKDGEVCDFDTAEEVAVHLWGRCLTQYVIFKHGVRWRRRRGGEVGEYQRALEQWQPRQN